jgi:hypothetical protein
MSDNELIANWMPDMEFVIPKNSKYTAYWKNKNTLAQFKPEALRYHKSWDWLMPVVDKIENTGDGFISRVTGCRIEGYLCDFVDQENTEISLQFSQTSKIEAVYKAVVEFIKWYNSQTPGV